MTFTDHKEPPLEQGDCGGNGLSIPLLKIGIFLGQNKKIITIFILSFGLIGLIVSLLLNPIFTAKTIFVVPTPVQGASAAQMLGNLGGLMGGGGAAANILGAGKSPDEMYIEFLKTKFIKDQLIQKYDLQKRYDKHSLEKVEKKLKDRTKLTSLKKAGLISIEVEDEDPKFAAELANGYISELRIMLESMSLTESSQRKEYYKQELIRARKELDGVTDYRDMKVRESVLAVILNQLEVATLDTARESLIQVPEVATPPEKRSFPKRIQILMGSIAAGFFAGIVFVFSRRALERAEGDVGMRGYLNAFKSAWRWSEKNK